VAIGLLIFGFACGILRIRSAYSPLLLRRNGKLAVPLNLSKTLNLAGDVAFNRSRVASSFGEGPYRTTLDKVPAVGLLRFASNKGQHISAADEEAL
jgi:hypothetical protein